MTPSIGVYGVWVNGMRVVDADGMLGSCPRAGQVLREFVIPANAGIQ